MGNMMGEGWPGCPGISCEQVRASAGAFDCLQGSSVSTLVSWQGKPD